VEELALEQVKNWPLVLRGGAGSTWLGRAQGDGALAMLFVIAALGLASCSGTGESNAGGAALGFSIECSVFHRATPTSRLRGKRVRLPGQNRQADVRAGPFGFSATFQLDPGEPATLSLEVLDRARKQTLARGLYQFRPSHPANQFRGGHGFTGLVYTYLPSGAELQHFCVRAR
jgi:hypothetical protein